MNDNSIEVRKWYISKVENIKNEIDSSLPVKEQSIQAYELRTKYKIEARNMMNDRESAKLLAELKPPLSYEALLRRKMKIKGMTEEEAVLDILNTSTVTNITVNKKLGL